MAQESAPTPDAPAGLSPEDCRPLHPERFARALANGWRPEARVTSTTSFDTIIDVKKRPSLHPIMLEEVGGTFLIMVRFVD